MNNKEKIELLYSPFDLAFSEKNDVCSNKQF